MSENDSIHISGYSLLFIFQQHNYLVSCKILKIQFQGGKMHLTLALNYMPRFFIFCKILISYILSKKHLMHHRLRQPATR